MSATKAAAEFESLLHDDTIVRSFGAHIRNRVVSAVRKVKNTVPERTQVKVFQRLFAEQPQALRFAIAAPLTATNRKALAAALVRATNVPDIYLREAIALGCLPEAATVLQTLLHATHLGGIVSILPRVKASAEVVEAARAALGGARSMKFDFLECCALAGLLAKDGGAASVQVLEGFAERAISAAHGETVQDPAQSLGHLLESAGKSAGVLSLAAILKGQTAARREASEPVALAQQLKLQLHGDNWSISVDLNQGASFPRFGRVEKTGPRIRLVITPTAKYGWHLTLEARRGSYSNRGGVVSQDDIGMPELESLAEVPAWIESAGQTLKIAFSVRDAVIDTGRFRAAQEPVRKWLGGA